MNLRYFILGINIVLISAMFTLYGLIINNPSLVGLFASFLITGSVIVVLSFTTREGLLSIFTSYSDILTRFATSIVEDFDLLESTLAVIRRGNNTYIVFTKSTSITQPEPGVGFNSNTPYIAILVNELMNDIEELSEANESVIETELNETFVEEFSVCRRIGAEYSGGSIKLVLVDVDDRVKEFFKYPLDPVTLLIMVALRKLINRDIVLKSKSMEFNNVVYVFEVLNYVEAS
ncbi:MAG: hypothetical protein QXJ69_00050 [Desulfurococcaceae archaeon]